MSFSTNIVEGRRKPIPKRIFTPTRVSAIMANHYLLFFDETESYQIVARSSIKKIDNEGSATLIIRNKLMKGKVVLSGTLEDCELELGRQTRLSQQINDNNGMESDKDEDAGDDGTDYPPMMAITQRSITTQSHLGIASSVTFDEPLSPENDEADDENYNLNDDLPNDNVNSTKKKSVSNKRKYASNSTSGKRKRIDNKTVNDIRTGPSDIDRDFTYSNSSILHALENKFSSLESQLLTIDNKNTQKMMKLSTKIDYLTASSITNKTLLEAYRDEQNELFTTEVMHETTNLLNTIASSIGDFARKTMRKVFAEQELKECVLPPSRSHLARPSLDEKRFQLVNEAVRVKFKLDSTKYAAFYKNILRRKLSDFLIEERRRESTRVARHMSRTTANAF